MKLSTTARELSNERRLNLAPPLVEGRLYQSDTIGSNVRVAEKTNGLEHSTSTLPGPPGQSDADSKRQIFSVLTHSARCLP